jgi:hypothetical protein
MVVDHMSHKTAFRAARETHVIFDEVNRTFFYIKGRRVASKLKVLQKFQDHTSSTAIKKLCSESDNEIQNNCIVAK